MTSDDRRWVNLVGSTNTRDVGGRKTADGKFQTKFGVLYRSAEISHLTEADWKELVRRGVRHICDLRRADEQALFAIVPPDGIAVHRWEYSVPSTEEMSIKAAQIRTLLAPLNAADDDTLAKFVGHQHAHYQDLPALMHDHLRGAFEVVLSGEPTIVLCQAGKDRTGFAIAFLLACAGVSIDEILDDFEMTTVAYLSRPPTVEYIRPLLVATGLDQLSDRVLRALSIANRPAMKGALESYVASHGSVAKYVCETLGITDDQIQKLRTILLEPI